MNEEDDEKVEGDADDAEEEEYAEEEDEVEVEVQKNGFADLKLLVSHFRNRTLHERLAVDIVNIDEKPELEVWEREVLRDREFQKLLDFHSSGDASSTAEPEVEPGSYYGWAQARDENYAKGCGWYEHRHGIGRFRRSKKSGG